jgi:hypothetical protein
LFGTWRLSLCDPASAKKRGLKNCEKKYGDIENVVESAQEIYVAEATPPMVMFVLEQFCVKVNESLRGSLGQVTW